MSCSRRTENVLVTLSPVKLGLKSVWPQDLCFFGTSSHNLYTRPGRSPRAVLRPGFGSFPPAISTVIWTDVCRLVLTSFFFLLPVFLLSFPARWSTSTQLCPSCLDPQIRPHFPSLQAANTSHATPIKQSGAQLMPLLKCLLFSPRYPYAPSYTRLRHRLIFCD